MVKSMTAYGRGELKKDEMIFVAEAKTVNNRYRDIILRIPKNFQTLEENLRSIISSRIRRGRVEVSIHIENSGEENQYNLELNVPLVNSYMKIFHQLNEQFGLHREIRAEALCQIRDVLIIKPETVNVDRVEPGFKEVLILALDSLNLMRTREGEAIEADFVKRLDLLEQYAGEVEKRVPELVAKHRKRLKEKIERMLKDVDLDEIRLAQEVALHAEKSDITEELVRMRSHLAQFRNYLSLDDALGRRLDFLIQEIYREVNTMSSKASDSLISGIVVEMKAELEKLREQIQNVE